jgi:hypothetical protein
MMKHAPLLLALLALPVLLAGCSSRTDPSPGTEPYRRHQRPARAGDHATESSSIARSCS